MKTPYVPHVFGEAAVRKLRSRVGWVSAAVASSVPWPQKDVWVQYAGDDFILRGTENGPQPTAPAITVPGDREELEQSLARVYRFTSVLGWFLGGYVDVVDVISGSHPFGFGAQMRHAFSTVGQAGAKSFNCNHMPIIEDENIRIALAFWREGERLRRVHDSYSFLSYFKVIESQYSNGRQREAWFNNNIDKMAGDAAARVAQLRAGGADVGRHLYDSGRNAVAHASFGGGIVDPDVVADRRRISADLVLMRELAWRYISEELRVPTARSLSDTRNRLESWSSLLDPVALATLEDGATPDASTLGLEGLRVGLALWPDHPMDGLRALTMHVDAVHEGAVRILLFNDRMTMMFAFVLDFRHGRIHTQLDNSSLLQNDEHHPVEDDVREFATVFHRVIGNAVVELCLEGREPIDCEVVIPVNIIPRNPDEAVEEAVEAFRRERGQQG
ncbi:methylamine utilization protein MauJ [Luteimonas kalidii]|uniref:Uncharacterized protein n=1 Tax=Luteimonas kalidii TaxID=3042025 RepID=A0ABT6JTD1_9GAMM|nr:methylamine utilization protein MauJ [Luteimonas kalidii]MDH5833947.1 hypothetical protein [Luteimonas kalidii]